MACKFIASIVSCFLFFTSLGYSLVETQALPSEFFLTYNALQSNSVFTFYAMQRLPFAKATREESENQLGFSYYSLTDTLLGSSKGTLENSEACLDVYDSDQKIVGTILRKKKPLGIYLYQIFDTHKKPLAEGSMNLLGTRFILNDPKNAHRQYVTFSRPYFHLPGDHWYVQIHQAGIIDNMIIVMVAALQTYIDKKNCEFTPDNL